MNGRAMAAGVALMLLLMVAAAPAAETVRVGIVPDEAAARTPLVDLLQVKLTGEPGLELVERAEVDALLREQALQQAWGSAGIGDRRTFGRRLGARLLVLLRTSTRSVDGADQPVVECAISETAHGLRVARVAIPWSPVDPEAAAEELATVVREARARLGQEMRWIFAVPPFESGDLVHDHDYLQYALADLVSSRLASQPGAQVVEIEEARALAQEATLVAADPTARPLLAFFVQGSYRNEGQGAARRLGVTLTLAREGKTILERKGESVAPEALAAFVGEATVALLAEATKAPAAPFDAAAESKALELRARRAAALAEYEQAIALYESCLLLLPDRTEPQLRIVEATARLLAPTPNPDTPAPPDVIERAPGLYRHALEVTARLLRGQNLGDGGRGMLPDAPVRRTHWAVRNLWNAANRYRGAEWAAPLFDERRAVLLEWLELEASRDRLPAAMQYVVRSYQALELEGGTGRFGMVEPNLLNDPLPDGEQLVRCLKLFAGLPEPGAANQMISSSRGIGTGPVKPTALDEERAAKRAALLRQMGAAGRELAARDPGVQPREAREASTSATLQAIEREMGTVGRVLVARRRAMQESPEKRFALLDAATTIALTLGNGNTSYTTRIAWLGILQNERQAAVESIKYQAEQRKRELETTVEVTERSHDPVSGLSVTVKRRVPTPRPNPTPRPGVVSGSDAPDVQFEPLPGFTGPLVGWERIDAQTDMLWDMHQLMLMRGESPPEPVLRLPPPLEPLMPGRMGPRTASVVFDGRWIWVGGSGELTLIDPRRGTVEAKLGAGIEFPPGQMMLAALAPGRVCIVGSTDRAWIGTLDYAGAGKARLDLFHEARLAQGSPQSAELAFTPVTMAAAGRGADQRVLVVRFRSDAGALYPLLVDPARRQVEVVPQPYPYAQDPRDLVVDGDEFVWPVSVPIGWNGQIHEELAAVSGRVARFGPPWQGMELSERVKGGVNLLIAEQGMALMPGYKTSGIGPGSKQAVELSGQLLDWVNTGAVGHSRRYGTVVLCGNEPYALRVIVREDLRDRLAGMAGARKPEPGAANTRPATAIAPTTARAGDTSTSATNAEMRRLAALSRARKAEANTATNGKVARLRFVPLEAGLKPETLEYPLQDGAFTFVRGEDDPAGFLTFSGLDQPDATVRKFYDGLCIAWFSDPLNGPGRTPSVQCELTAPLPEIRVKVTDAAGTAIEGATVVARFRRKEPRPQDRALMPTIVVEGARTGKDGEAPLLAAPGGFNSVMVDAYGVVHPEFGRWWVRPEFAPRGGGELRLPTCSAAAAAGGKGLALTVTDPEGKPLEGAVGRLLFAQPPGGKARIFALSMVAGAKVHRMGGYNVLYGLTGADGKLVLRLPEETGVEPLPAGALYRIAIEPPAGIDLPPLHALLDSGKPHTIALGRDARPVTIEAVDAEGKAIALDQLRPSLARVFDEVTSPVWSTFPVARPEEIAATPRLYPGRYNLMSAGYLSESPVDFDGKAATLRFVMRPKPRPPAQASAPQAAAK